MTAKELYVQFGGHRDKENVHQNHSINGCRR